MNVKKEVLEKVKGFFQNEIHKINLELRSNKRKMNEIHKSNTILKRSKAKLDQFSREIS